MHKESSGSGSTRRVISHYELLEPLGMGGMGEVWVGFDLTLQRKVALKAVRRERRLDQEAKARLLREGRLLSQLDHPHICRVYDYVEDDDNAFVVLELIAGITLREAIDNGLDTSRRMAIAEQITSALVAAHAAGIVHRDLKPSNVMLLADGSVKVLDFGLATSSGGRLDSLAAIGTLPPALDPEGSTIAYQPVVSDVGPTITVPGALMGTLAYMSPEQARGEGATAPSDMYALGLLLQELFTGRRPYDVDAHADALLARIQLGITPAPVGLSRDLTNLIQRLKALAPTQRPTAVDVQERLQEIREKPRKRLQFIAAGLALAVVAAGGVKYTLDVTRERGAAVAAREEATQRRRQAEDLIGFMLGDLRGKLQKVGRLDVLDDVGQKAMTYFAGVPAGSLSNEEILRQSQAVHQIGQVRMAQGNLAAATAAFSESLKLATNLAARDPANGDWQLGLATSHFYVGEVLRLQADFAGALRHYETYRDIAQALYAREPKNRTWILELSYGRSNVAAALEARGDLEGARRELTESLGLKRQLVVADPNNTEWQESVANGYNRLGIVLGKLGDDRAAMEQFQAAFDLRKALLTREPDNARALREVADAASYVSLAYEGLGQVMEATKHGRARLGILETLAARDPANVDSRRELAVSQYVLARFERTAGRPERAIILAQHAWAILKPLADHNPGMYRRQQDAAQAETELAATYLELGHLSDSIEHATAAVAPLQALARQDPNDAASRRSLAETYLIAARAWLRRGDVARARMLRERAYETLSEIAQRWNESRLQAVFAVTLLELGRRAEAEPIVTTLGVRGYQNKALLDLYRDTMPRWN